MNTSSREWFAVDRTTSVAGGEREIVVNGVVDLPSSSHTARLVKAEPQGFNPSILLIDLLIEQSGIGADVITPRAVEYNERPIKEGQYEQVDVRSDQFEIPLIDVSISHS